MWIAGAMLLAGAYSAVCGFLWLGQNRLIYITERGVPRTPAELGLDYEDVYIPVADDEGKQQRIHGWWVPGNSDRVLLYLHGNGFNVAANLEQAHRFQRLGFSVLLIDYRGFGQSDGAIPSEAHMYQDARAAWEYLLRERCADSGRTFIYGHSLGGAVAVDLAACVPAAGLIVEGSFTSLLEMACRERRYRIFPLSLLLHQRFDSFSKVSNLCLPVLYIHGLDDEVVPYEMSERLYRETGAKAKRLVLIPGGGHETTAEVGGSRYLAELEAFVEAALQTELAADGVGAGGG